VAVRRGAAGAGESAVPGSLDELPPGGPYTLLAFDGDGSVVARVDLDEFYRETRPR
jgi:hypothetical protein